MRGKRGAGNDLFLDLGADYMHVVYFVKIHYTLYDLHTFYAICQKNPRVTVKYYKCINIS